MATQGSPHHSPPELSESAAQLPRPVGPAPSIWANIWARVSTPSTSRGPGRAKDALASTAHTGARSGSTPDATRARGQRRRTGEVVAAGRAHDEVRLDRERLVPASPAPTSRPASPIVGTPPAAVTISGTQWPGAKGGSVHSSSSTRGAAPAARAATCSRTVSSRARSEPTRRSASAWWPVAAPSTPIEPSTSVEVVRVDRQRPRRCSRDGPARRRPRETSTAQTAHRSWVTTRSASRPLRAPSSRW